MSKIDLHIHTTASDGEYSPKEVIELAIQKNMETIAITDHDTISGLNEALEYSKNKKIRVVKGVEIGCDEPKLELSDIHILGLFIDSKNKDLNDLLNWLGKNRLEQKKQIIQNLQDLGYNITFQELERETRDSFGRPHIAKILMRKYPRFKDVEQVFNELLANGKKAYVKQEKCNIKKVIETINLAGGISILAHPGIYSDKTSLLLNKFVVEGGNGIEVYYPYYKIYDFSAEFSNKLFMHFKKIAESKNLLITGGSDFHRISRKSEIGDEGINEAEMKKILAHLSL